MSTKKLQIVGGLGSYSNILIEQHNTDTTSHADIREQITHINDEKANKNEIPTLTSQLENDSNFISEEYVESLFKSLNSDMVLRFYCIEDVTIITNGTSITYPANSNVEIKFLETDVFEIVPTSNNSILALNAFPGALGTYYPWLEGVKQFSNILFDMNDEDMYSKWSQGNQGSYQVQYAQYLNCIFWSDNPYISDVAKRTNYTLYYTSQLPLCYSNIPDNTFKAFYLAFNVNSDPNWGNKAYRDSFAKATWATQVFSYYGARTIGIFGHDSPNFNIILPKDCRGLMSAATAIENAGTFDAINTTNFGAKSGSWRDAFGWCSSLRNLYIKNLKVNLNISWSPIEYDSIYYIISSAANTNKITISVSPYTYNLLGTSDFELAASKNITIELLTANYIEDKRLGEISNKADKTYVDEKIANLVDSAPDTLNTIGELATAIKENKEVVDILNEAIVVKADKTYVDELITNIPTEPDTVIISCPDGSTISHTFEQIMEAVNGNKSVYVSIYGSIIAPLTYIAEDGSYIEFNSVNSKIAEDQNTTVWIDGLKVNNDNSFTVKYIDLLPRIHNEINGPEGEKDIVVVINHLVEKSNETVLLTEQSLTEEQKAQVKANLGISNNNTSVGSDPVTTEYIYTYDGDTNSDEHGWITNYGDIKVFAKIGEIPQGELNLVGSTIYRTNPSNEWLNRTFTITEEHLTKVLNKSGEDIPAVQEGLIQIYDIMASDFSEFTVLCICTKAGWYNVCFDDWFEIINFPETGIFAYDKRTYGGNDYLKTFTFSATYTQTSGGTSGGIDTSIPIKYTGNEISVFSRGICIGDSVTEGSFDNDNGGVVVKRFAYPAILERITGIDVVNAGIAGATSKTWYEATLNSDDQWGKWLNDEWIWNTNPQASSTDVVSSSLNYSNFDFAIIHLGINDFGLMSETDTMENMLVTFEEYINNIINKLKTHNNGIKIFLATIVPSYAHASHAGFVTMNSKIREIASGIDDVYLLDLNKYSELASKEEYNVIHPTALGYQKLANEISCYISYIIHNNLNDFKEIQFIGDMN